MAVLLTFVKNGGYCVRFYKTPNSGYCVRLCHFGHLLVNNIVMRDYKSLHDWYS